MTNQITFDEDEYWSDFSDEDYTIEDQEDQIAL